MASIQDLENNNQIILDPLGNIYEMCANLTVMTLLHLNHFWITQEICLKGAFVKSKFHVFSSFLDIYENPGRKNFIYLSCPKHPKISTWNINWQIFIFTLLCDISDRFHLFEALKKVWKLELCFVELLNNRDT